MGLLLYWDFECEGSVSTSIDAITALVVKVTDNEWSYVINDGPELVEGTRTSQYLAQVAVEQYILS